MSCLHVAGCRQHWVCHVMHVASGQVQCCASAAGAMHVYGCLIPFWAAPSWLLQRRVWFGHGHAPAWAHESTCHFEGHPLNVWQLCEWQGRSSTCWLGLRSTCGHGLGAHDSCRLVVSVRSVGCKVNTREFISARQRLNALQCVAAEAAIGRNGGQRN